MTLLTEKLLSLLEQHDPLNFICGPAPYVNGVNDRLWSFGLESGRPVVFLHGLGVVCTADPEYTLQRAFTRIASFLCPNVLDLHRSSSTQRARFFMSHGSDIEALWLTFLRNRARLWVHSGQAEKLLLDSQLPVGNMLSGPSGEI